MPGKCLLLVLNDCPSFGFPHLMTLSVWTSWRSWEPTEPTECRMQTIVLCLDIVSVYVHMCIVRKYKPIFMLGENSWLCVVTWTAGCLSVWPLVWFFGSKIIQRSWWCGLLFLLTSHVSSGKYFPHLRSIFSILRACSTVQVAGRHKQTFEHQ